MSNKIILAVAAASFALAAASAQARGNMGGGMGTGGGMSSGHMSAEGMANTNGPNAADRDKGLARAEDRQNAMAASHEKAQKHRKAKGTEAAGTPR
ncbi:MAG: hypothetical protein ACM3Y9_13690 [Ignavibacteria bacterium]